MNEDSFSESHGIVNGEWIIIYDEYEDATCVIYKLGTFSKPISPEADKLLIQEGFSLSVIVNTPLQDVIALIQEKVNSLKGITSPYWILNQSELLVYTPELEISEEPITETLTFTNGEVVTEDTIVSITIIEKPQEEPQEPEDPDNPNPDNPEDNNDENNQGNVQEQENQEDNPNQESNIPTTEDENNNQEPVNDDQNTGNNSTDTESSGNTNGQESNTQEENTSSNTGQEENT